MFSSALIQYQENSVDIFWLLQNGKNETSETMIITILFKQHNNYASWKQTSKKTIYVIIKRKRTIARANVNIWIIFHPFLKSLFEYIKSIYLSHCIIQCMSRSKISIYEWFILMSINHSNISNTRFFFQFLKNISKMNYQYTNR